jgi:hypothetical protein
MKKSLVYVLAAMLALSTAAVPAFAKKKHHHKKHHATKKHHHQKPHTTPDSPAPKQ